jgi:hypothetical protein
VTAESELAGFNAKFDPIMQTRIRDCRAKMQQRFPHAFQLVYDNYNFLVVGFGPDISSLGRDLFAGCPLSRAESVFFAGGL